MDELDSDLYLQHQLQAPDPPPPLWAGPISANDANALRDLLRRGECKLADSWTQAPGGPWVLYSPLAHALACGSWEAVRVILEFKPDLTLPVVRYQDKSALCAAAWGMQGDPYQSRTNYCQSPVEVLAALLGDGPMPLTDVDTNVWIEQALSNSQWAQRGGSLKVAYWRTAVDCWMARQRRKQRCLLATVLLLGLRRYSRTVCMASSGKDTLRIVAAMLISSKYDAIWDRDTAVDKEKLDEHTADK
jgi:hypothetical protein